MRVARFIVPAAALFALCASSASAQILRGIGKRAADAVERKTEQKVNQEIDKAAERLVNQSFESMFGSDDETESASKKSGNRSPAGSKLFSAFPSAPTEEQYDFDVVFHYEIETAKKNNKDVEKALMQMHFNKAGNYAGTRFMPADKKKEDGELFAIFDVKNESMVMLIESEDGRMSMAYSWKEAKRYADTVSAPTAVATKPAASPAPVAAPATTVNYTSLGTKKIAGYEAEGFRSESPDARWDVWISRDPALSFNRMMGASSSMKQLRGTMPTDHPAGMLLETSTLDKTNGETGRMTVTKVEKDAGVKVMMKDYPRIGKASAK